jgi:phosphoglycolate phosphatase-like HAD superfamily hydrolase
MNGGQFGSDTFISDAAQLVIFDCFDTLVQMQARQYSSRRGVRRLLNHLRVGRRQLAVLSDGPRTTVMAALRQAGLDRHFDAVYSQEDGCDLDPDGVPHKRLDRVIMAFGLASAACFFIGDSPRDASAARKYQVPFVRVPGSADEQFSFACLIGGASRYNSSEYERILVDQYRKPHVR